MSRMDIKLSDSCNLHCNHCSLQYDLKDKPVDEEAISRVIERVKSDEIHISGGEVFSNKESTLALYHLILKYPWIQWRVTTNLCYKLTPLIVQVFGMVTYLQTSFDINVRFHSLKNLLLWKRNACFILKYVRKDLTVITVLTKYLVKKDPIKLKKFYDDIGFYKYEYVPLINHEDLRPNMDEYHEWMIKMVQQQDIEKNLTFRLIKSGEFMSCYYGYIGINTEPWICIDVDGKYKQCAFTNKDCRLQQYIDKCMVCNKHCKGRCLCIKCMYDKTFEDIMKWELIM